MTTEEIRRGGHLAGHNPRRPRHRARRGIVFLDFWARNAILHLGKGKGSRTKGAAERGRKVNNPENQGTEPQQFPGGRRELGRVRNNRHGLSNIASSV